MTNSKNSWKNLSFVGLVQVVATFTIILSILTLFDEKHRYIELFSHFKIQYLLASVTCAVILALYKSYAFSIVLVLAAVLNSVFVVPWYFSDPKNIPDNVQADVTLLHSNVFTNNVKFKNFIELVNKENPDIFVMQEVNQKWLSETRELEKIYPHMLTIPREDNFGIALFSKYPFDSIKEVNLSDSDIPSIVATLLITGQLVTVITTHPLPPVGKDYYHSRNAQIDKVAEMSRNHQGPLIIIGDLNLTMWSDDYMPLELGTDLRNARKGFGMLPTFPAQFQLPIFMIPIDHCLVSSHFVVHDIKVGKDIGSDHLPLIIKLSLKNRVYSVI
jgi:endonuclease/exonuclease/phosphatase (EEP) superfamily protein YafD